MKTPYLGFCALLACLMAGQASTCHAQAIPPPGHYQVDMTSTFRWVVPTGVTERVEQNDGATGRSTVTTTSSSTPQPVVTVYPGSGPHHECQKAGKPIVAGNCVAKLETHDDVATSTFTCEGQAQQLEFRKISAGVWEKRLKISPARNAAPMALPPQVAAAMAPVIEKMEARARTAPPQEAAELREQIAAIRNGGAAASAGPDVENVQRWTLISNHCPDSK